MSFIGSKKVFEKRIGDIAFQVWKADEDKGYRSGDYWDIVKYEPNYYYYHKEEFVESQYRPGSFVKKTDGPDTRWYVDKSCFKNPETCVVIASLTQDWDRDCLEGYELHYVFDRPVRLLDKEQEKDFMEVVRYAYNYLEVEKDKDEYDEN